MRTHFMEIVSSKSVGRIDMPELSLIDDDSWAFVIMSNK